MTVISEQYRQLNRQLHEEKDSYGAGHQTRQWYAMIDTLARKMGAVSVLDYGAGKGKFAQSFPQLMVEQYDPAIPGLDDPPEPCDFVICLDVLEHIEPELLDNVLDDIQRCTKKAVFLTVNMFPARKVLADGRNAHLIQKPVNWWIPKLMARWDMRNFGAQDHEFNFFGLAKKVAA
jgi:2-polyprenyl-3-methyl-5-hydroxy-6-metoxy-1,4-benzoquinol methylase